MKLIFLRHGIAEEKGNVDDFDRKLTPKGIEKLNKYLPYLAAYLEKKDPEIWSSPKVRADETAQLLKENLFETEIIYKDFIASGDLGKLDEELSQTEEKTIVLVGHEPFLSAWTREITGEEVVIKKGGGPRDRIRPGGQRQ
ncbi:SixA phosphatase family protein [Gallicola sp. Sow4_E12]|uniref:SixA phosphatase family protein n=1 Tax=Gallicola sp. Sow4_E12 TaxID=3438785 RepID=UPI003F927760